MKKDNDKIMLNIITLVSISIAILEAFIFVNIDVPPYIYAFISILLFILTVNFIINSKKIKDENKRKYRVYIGIILLSLLIFPTLISLVFLLFLPFII